MEASIIAFVCIIAIPLLLLWQRKAAERLAQSDRKKDIEAAMRQDIIDTQTQKEVAAKLLREAGQKP